MSTNPIAAVASTHRDHSFIGHPRGLGYLSFSEAWERFSYYGMQTLLVLYMVRQLLLPGHVERILGFGAFRAALEHAYGEPLSTVALSSAIFGLYTGLVYLTPIAGGIVADRWLGRTRTVTIGALLMAAGHFLMAFEATFLIALACLLIGVGGFKGNIASQVGALYAPEDLRRADAFQIYFLFINIAVIVSPLIAGTLGEVYGWHYGFGAAGVGMLISVGIYLRGRRWLPSQSPKRRSQQGAGPGGAGTGYRTPGAARMSPVERRAVLVLVLLLPVLAIGAVGNQQIFNAYLLWVPGHVDLVFFGRTMPTTWLITLDAAVSVGCLLGAVAFWRLWAKHFTEPAELTKMALGLGISAAGLLCLAGAATVSATGHRAGPGWILAFEFLNSFGFANMFPVGLALYARASPAKVAGTMIGVYYLHLFLANNLVGWLGGLVERMPGTRFWSLHALLVGGAGAVLLIIARLAGPLLAGAGARER